MVLCDIIITNFCIFLCEKFVWSKKMAKALDLVSALRRRSEQQTQMPYWISKHSVSSFFVVASFPPCSCEKGHPPTPVCQEKVRYGPNRTLAEATTLLVAKVGVHCCNGTHNGCLSQSVYFAGQDARGSLGL